MTKNLILAIGWPTLIVVSVLISRKGIKIYKRLKGTALGSIVYPTIFGWLFGMYSLGIVSTAYMLDYPWYYFVIPAFLVFMVAIIIVYRVIDKWMGEASDLRDYYDNLEKLLEKRTSKLEEAHQRQIKHEKEIQKLKDQFVFIAAHELKTPVTAINWGIEMALEEEKDLDPEILDLLEGVHNSNKRLVRLVDDLLNVARIEAKTIKIEQKDVNLDKLIKQTIKEMESVFTKKAIEVEYDSQGEILVYADEMRLKQVLTNYLSNAVKYNKDRGKILVKVEEKKDKVKILVKDTGIGIAKKDLKKIFTKFGRVQNKKTEDIEGTGLGLYVSKQVIEKMGGEVDVESTPGKGSTFSFTVSST